MKRIKWTAMKAAMIIMGVTIVHAGPDHDMAPYVGSKEFQRIKGLEGHWEGTSTDMSPDKTAPQKVTVDYHATSGGSVVVETLGAGTPHEMVSIYHDENGQLTMTHYCMLRNQPHLSLKKSSESEIFLEVGKNGGVAPQSFHMHSLTLDLSKPNQLVQKWTSFEGGKEKASSTFNYTRKS